MSHDARERKRWRGPAAACLAAMAFLAACESKDPHKPLTADEGAVLMKDIRDKPGQKRDLTPAERAYLRDQLKK